MTVRCILIALAMCSLFPVASAAQGHPTPSMDVVGRLRRHHHRGDWWRVTTDSTRFEVRVATIETGGLAGLTSRRRESPAPEQLEWRSIQRIDLRKAPRLGRRIIWGILGMSAGFIPLANGNDNGPQPGLFLLGGAVMGVVLGGHVSEDNVHEEALYVAPTLPKPPAATVASMPEAARSARAAILLPSGTVLSMSPGSAAIDSGTAPTAANAVTMMSMSAPAEPPATVSPPASSPSAANTLAIERACRRLSTQQLLRIDGAFGTFHGYASSIRPEGLGGMRIETRYPSVQPPDPLTWDRISRVEVHGGNAGSGALRGALVLGGGAGLLGAMLGAALGSDSEAGAGASAAGAGLAAFGIGATVGAMMGGAIGATISGWHLVYRRP